MNHDGHIKSAQGGASMARVDCAVVPGNANAAGWVRLVVAGKPHLEHLVLAPSQVAAPVTIDLDLDDAERLRNRLLQVIDQIKEDLASRTTGTRGAG